MNDIQRIISVISEQTDIAPNYLLHSKSSEAVDARLMMYYIAHRTTNCKTSQIAEYMEQSISTCYARITTAIERYSTDDTFRETVDIIDAEIQRRNQTRDPKKYHNPFGVDYTELEELKMKRAKHTSIKFMRNYGKGDKPLRKGFPLTRAI